MAQKVSVMLVDDLDGSEATETVTFGIDGVNYEIDLSNENAQRLRNALAPYVGEGRKVGGGARRRPAGRAAARSNGGGSGSTVDTNSVREWARANGHSVADRGRIRSDIIEAYKAATR
jgi:hypothetical protein